jgi:hypothetical protein
MDWQPIETAPKDGTRVLVWASKWAGEIAGVINEAQGSCRIAYYTNGQSDYSGDWWNDDVGDAYSTWCQPTHWMPLPPPPYATKADSDGDGA